MPVISAGGNVVTVTRKLTNAQILALPTVPVAVVAATETPNYLAALATVPVPVFATVTVTTTAGAYTNINVTSCTVMLSWGNGPDWDVMTLVTSGAIDKSGELFNSSPSPVIGFFGLPVYSGAITNPPATFHDNGLYLAVYNSGSGNLTGGNAANTATVRVTYVVYPIPPS